MVEMMDGSVICQIGVPDMRAPIQYALGYPDRFAGPVAPFDFGRARTFEFLPVDRERFPSLDLAYAALRAGGTAPAVLNAANEVAVGAFLAGRLGFLGIARMVREVLDRHAARPVISLEDVLEGDRVARRAAEEILAMQVLS
jgi:1-deoxy-D-xylulose-5-phosphate reductoisomerase